MGGLRCRAGTGFDTGLRQGNLPAARGKGRESEPVNCILLAGGRPARGEALYPLARGAPKALLQVAGRPMIGWVLDALRAARSVDRILVVGLDAGEAAALQELADGGGVDFLRGHGSLVDNLYAGIAALSDTRPVLYCGSDIPLIRAAAVDRFVAGGWQEGIDIAAGLVSRAALQTRYPGVEDLWLRLREGEFIAADLAVFDPAAAPAARRHLEVLAPQRKSALRQARYVGVGLLLRYLLRRLTVPQFEDHLHRRFGLRARIQLATDPEVGLDVDGPAALELCDRMLSTRR